MYALTNASLTHTFCGNYAIANAITDELVALASEKDTVFLKAQGMLLHGQLSALTGKASSAIETGSAGMAAYRSTGSTVGLCCKTQKCGGGKISWLAVGTRICGSNAL
jgi:hypothetical protein